MSKDNDKTDTTGEANSDKPKIPPQESPTDISNWVDRPLNTPSGRVVIETDQTDDGVVIAE